MQNTRSVWSRIVTILAGLIYIVFGFIMIQSPNTTLKALSLLMGWVVTISGVVAVAYAISYRRFDEYANKTGLMEGVLLLILGLMLLFGNFINNTLILAYLLVFWIIMDSAFQLQLAAFIPKTSIRILIMILDILVISFGVFLLFNPAGAEEFLVFYTGFGFVTTGIGKLIKSF